MACYVPVYRPKYGYRINPHFSRPQGSNLKPRFPDFFLTGEANFLRRKTRKMGNFVLNYHMIKHMEQTIQYMKTFCKDKGIASITPSSPFAVKRICNKIDFTKDTVIVECGPGNGVFSFAILRQMSPGSRLILIEANRDFVRYLDQRIPDPRVSVFHDNAINIQSIVNQCGLNTADYVIMGIPFSLSDHEQNHSIIANCKKVLKDTF